MKSGRDVVARGPALSARLTRIAAFVPDGARVADIGTDHARLPVYLVVAGRSPSAIAVDVRAGAAAQARRTIARWGVADRVAVRLGDGLGPLAAAECDCVVIAGMGGPAIVRILDADPRRLEGVVRLVLGPQSAPWAVRWWLRRNGWALHDEAFVVDDGIGYAVLAAERGDGRAAYRAPYQTAALAPSTLLSLGPLLARAADRAWCDHWLSHAAALEARGERVGVGGTPGARRAAARQAWWAGRVRAAVTAAAAAAAGR